MIDLWILKDIETEVVAELIAASHAHGSFNSAHEGYAVLKEEVDELWDEIKRKERSPAAMRKEAVQVAAMALRFLYDLRDTGLHASVESGSAHSPAPEPQSTQRNTELLDLQTPATASHHDWRGPASPHKAHSLCQD
jgi:hypothetical protein